ncbi:tetratricopeptide repeat protein [Thalassoroseus pseudoceratinae]|uniref:tetratricopeptide repeat protein n=1 Tax=Thalassoroseus pseudoceratinae TaxID=2713176 RepID=UPI001421FC59|nr:tetratricopeptide repeat protein [Thalassoroseus pseudoceratinae]
MRFSWMRHSLTAAMISGALCGCANLSDRNATTATPTEQAANEFQVRSSMARLHERQGDLAKARTMFEQLVLEHPEKVELHHRLMVIYTRLDQHDLASQQFELARQLKPDNASLYADRGYALYLAGDLEQAESLLKHAYELDSQDERVVVNLATVTGAMGRVDESWSLFRRVLDDAEAHANVGFVLMQRGELGLAKKHYSIALDLDPKSNAAKNALVQIAYWEEKQRSAKPRVVASVTPTTNQTAAPVQLASATAPPQSAPAPVDSEPTPERPSQPWFGSATVTVEATPPVVDMPSRLVPTPPQGQTSESNWQLPTAVAPGQ